MIGRTVIITENIDEFYENNDARNTLLDGIVGDGYPGGCRGEYGVLTEILEKHSDNELDDKRIKTAFDNLNYNDYRNLVTVTGYHYNAQETMKMWNEGSAPVWVAFEVQYNFDDEQFMEMVSERCPVRKVWARIGMTLELTEEEYNELKTQMEKEGRDTLTGAEARMFLKQGYADGESYIPKETWED